MTNIPVQGGDQPGHQLIWNEYGDKMVISDNGSRVDVYNDTLHSWSNYNQQGQMTSGGAGDTHPH